MDVYLLLGILSAVDVSIIEPVDGGVYDGDWLTLRAIVQNENLLPDSVVFSLNGEPFAPVPRLVTDWPTYMQCNLHHGFSESPAPMTDDVLWTAPVCSQLHTFENPIVVEGVVYQVGRSSVHALDAATGQEIWSYPIGAHDDPPSYVDGRLYVQGGDSVFCLDAASGERVWAFHGPTADGGTPCVTDGRVACAGYDNSFRGKTRVYCLSASDGRMEWETVISGQIGNCMASFDGVFLVGTWNGPLCALDAGTGQTVWSHTITEGGYWDTSPTIVDGKIYIGGCDGAVHRFDAMTGSLEWETQISSFWVEPTPAVFEDIIICGAAVPSDSSVFAIRMSDGSLLWSIPNSLHGSPAVADGVVFWGGFEDPYDVVYAADAATGNIIWTHDVSSDVWGLHCTPAVTDGVMYFGSTDGNLYAFGTGLKWTYRDDFLAQVGSNQLIADSWSGGAVAASDTIQFTVTQTGIVTNPGGPSRPALSVSPNPFTSNATVSFELDSPCWSSLRVFDITGRLVGTIHGGESRAGLQNLVWGGTDDSGGRLPPGVYTLVLSSPLGDATETVCLLR